MLSQSISWGHSTQQWLLSRLSSLKNRGISQKSWSYVQQRQNSPSQTDNWTPVQKSDKNTYNFNKSDDKVFQCNNCNYKSSSENGIKIHMSKKYIHVCQFCYTKFTNPVDKSRHVLDCGSYNPNDSPTRGQFPPRFPPRFPQRFPNSPMW